MSSTYPSPSLNFYKHAGGNHNGCVLVDLGSVGVSEFGISFPLSVLLAGLLLQHMLHTSVCFVSCNHCITAASPETAHCFNVNVSVNQTY